MRTQARVVVIGGGVVGCSVLYHLTRHGWSDICLIERSELTSGSTWHAAGGFHTLNSDTNMAALQGYTIRLYRELEQITGQSCGLHHVGGVTIATDQDRLDYLVTERAKHRYMGLDTEIIGPEEIQRRSPITNVEGVVGGLYDPLDGHLDPSGTTHAYAKAAQMAGAEILLRTPVTALTMVGDEWDVVTEQGTIRAQHVVNAAGLWAREVGAMAGVHLPLHPMEHQYFVTDNIPEVYEREEELPHVMDPAGETYLRQEGQGLVIGIYEQKAVPWAVDGTPWDFGHELLNDDLERVAEPLEAAFRRYPVLGRAGIKRTINGPFTFAPDGNPLVGPIPGMPGMWAACAVMAGFSQGGGVGKALAEWMVEGETETDVYAMDVARFGEWANRGYTRLKVTENYQRRFSIGYPNEELPVARPLETTPAYGIWDQQNAVFGSAYGMEHVNYFAPPGKRRFEEPTFRRSNAFDAVAEECRAVREAVGLNEIHNFGKYIVSGPNAVDWLNRIMANRVPDVGRMALTPMLSPRGRIIGDFTMARIGEDRVQLTASYAAQQYHMRWFLKHRETGVEIENVSKSLIGFQIAGPNARELLGRVTGADVSNDAIRFLSVHEMHVGHIPVRIQRVSYTGDLGYEVYCASEHQVALYNAIAMEATGLGLRGFGMRAMMSLRLEKFFGSWLREFKPDYTPAEVGLDRFISWKKNDFIGRDIAVAERETPPARKLVAMLVDADGADAHGWEPVFDGSEVIGFVTSGGYAHYSKQSVAMALIPAEDARDGKELSVEILGDVRPAVITSTHLVDADGARMRG
ncbi:MAG: FAD-dependent oxidoreductase [Pseudomonadota bacterium]